MRWLLWETTLLAVLIRSCAAWVSLSTPPRFLIHHQTPSMAVSPLTMQKNPLTRKGNVEANNELINATRIRKWPPASKALQRTKGGSSWRSGSWTTTRISLLLSVAALVVLPRVSHAALSSTVLSATAATAALRPSTPTLPSTWQGILLVALWLGQQASTAYRENLWLAFVGGLKQSAVWYMGQIAAHPVVTKSVTAGVIGVIGDFLAQNLEAALLRRQRTKQQVYQPAPTKTYDPRRGLSIAVDGLLISGPLMHYGYQLFDRIIPIEAGGGATAALLHVLLDSVFLDAFFVASTFVVTGRMEGYSFRQLLPQLRKDYRPALQASWATSLLVAPIEFACFRFLPLSLRVLAVNFIDVIWDAVISFMAHRSRGGGPHQDERVY